MPNDVVVHEEQTTLVRDTDPHGRCHHDHAGFCPTVISILEDDKHARGSITCVSEVITTVVLKARVSPHPLTTLDERG
jgi:hypothetical protein